MQIANRPSRDRLVAAILEFLAGRDLLAADDIRVELEREIDAAGPDAVLALKAHLSADTGWDYYPPDPLARGIHHRLADRFLAEGSALGGAHHLAQVAGAPVILFANHLSYSDANVIEVLLHRSGGVELANRLTALAGPKVFSDRNRRFSSLCFGTIKVPQSAGVSSEEAVLDAREVARAARRSIEVAHERLDRGDALVLFAEGRRSRTASMQPLLAGVTRYLEKTDAWVVPMGMTGPEALFPVDDPTLRPTRVVLEIGAPMRTAALLARTGGNRRLTMDIIGLAIAALLPPEYRGVYGNPDEVTAAAEALRDLRSSS